MLDFLAVVIAAVSAVLITSIVVAMIII